MSTRTLLLALGISIMTAGIIAAVVCGMTLTKEEPSLPPNRMTIATGDEVEIVHGDEMVIRGELGVTLKGEGTECKGSDGSVIECLEWPSVAKLEVRMEEDVDATCYHFSWSASTTDAILQDCYDIDDAHWYGGSAIYDQNWPISEWTQPMTIYGSASIYQDPTYYGSLVERYWVSSRGVAVRVSHRTPLYVSVNESGDGKICFRGHYGPAGEFYTSYPNPEAETPVLDYKVCAADNVLAVHEYMTNRFVQKATGLPDRRMMRSPVWSTWARYKKLINQSRVLDFANEILDYGFNNSQLEIDDGYSGRNFGDFIFDHDRFSDPAAMIQELHDMGFRVTIWITPFANPDTSAWAFGNTFGYWVKNSAGETANVQWWNGLQGAGMLDVTNPQAVSWFVGRLNQAKRKFGIDSFKFDAGETQYIGSFSTQEPLKNPCEYTTRWVQLAGQLGDMIEVRSSYENQREPRFLRMMDKDSKWGWDNGLKTLVTTALTYSVLGYSYVLPDMIGGNGYPFFGIFPDRELYVRWLQITAFLPAMQYSISPWQYIDQDNSTEVVDIALRWTRFHEDVVTPKMIRLAQEEYVPHGKPLVRPLWWLAPTDPETFVIDTQFAVGDDWIVAPIVENGARSRDVYLPAGQWLDEINGVEREGGMWFRDVSCGLDEILYFTKM